MKRLARMALLPAGPLARWFPQTADPRRLVLSVAGRWLAAVAAVQPETALQLRQPPCQHRILGAKQRILLAPYKHPWRDEKGSFATKENDAFASTGTNRGDHKANLELAKKHGFQVTVPIMTSVL